MRNILTATILILLFSCKKEISDKELSQALDQSITATGEASQIPTKADIIIPFLNESNFGYPMGVGVDQPRLLNRTVTSTFQFSYPQYTIGQTYRFIVYNCPLTNIAPQSADGSTNLIVPKASYGTYDSIFRRWRFKNFLKVITWFNGKPILETKKESYDLAGTSQARDWKSSMEPYLGIDTMGIPARTADDYAGWAEVPMNENLQTPPGYYVIDITFNPLHVLPESDYDNNRQFLPVRINADQTIVIDSAAFSANSGQVNNLTGVANLKGKLKSVSLSWSGQADYYEVYKDGLIVKNTTDNSFIDIINGGFHSTVYTVKAYNSLGFNQQSITVSR